MEPSTSRSFHTAIAASTTVPAPPRQMCQHQSFLSEDVQLFHHHNKKNNTGHKDISTVKHEWSAAIKCLEQELTLCTWDSILSGPKLCEAPAHHCCRCSSRSQDSDVQSSWQLSQASTHLAGFQAPGRYLPGAVLNCNRIITAIHIRCRSYSPPSSTQALARHLPHIDFDQLLIASPANFYLGSFLPSSQGFNSDGTGDF